MPASDMQERKNKQRLIMLVILTTITAGVYWLQARDKAGPVDKNIFKTADLKSVDKVVLRSDSGEVALTYHGSRWKVNDRWNADRNMIDVLFATLRQAEPKRPVSASLADSLGSALEQQGVKVTLFSKDAVAQEFFAGGNAEKTKAYFKKGGTKGGVFVMTIPGYRVYVSGIFELAESGWRDKYIFGFNWQNFQRLAAQYPKNTSGNFEVTMQDHYFGIPGIQADTTRLNDFLDAVSLLTADDFLKTTPQLDSLGKTTPVQVLTVKDIGNREYSLQLYPFSGNRMAGLVNHSEWAVFEPRKLRNILRSKDFFGGH